MFKTPVTERLMINYTLDRMQKKGIKTLAFMGLDDAYGEGGWIELKALPLGSQRLVEVARALAANPSVILLDEPAAGLPALCLRLARRSDAFWRAARTAQKTLSL